MSFSLQVLKQKQEITLFTTTLCGCSTAILQQREMPSAALLDVKFIQQNSYYCSTLHKSLYIHRVNLVRGREITNYGISTLTYVYALYTHFVFTENVNETAAYPGTQFASQSCGYRKQPLKRNVNFASYDAYGSTVAMSNF
jgi:hypothetical protein